jgi:hypothetical protein
MSKVAARPMLRTYRVWFEQVNADMIEVKAVDPEEAKRIAAVRWRYINLHPQITDVKESK